MSELKVFITGESGFVGTRLRQKLVLSANEAVPSSHAFTPLDLLNFDSIVQNLKRESWTHVVHLAGISHVPTCEKDPTTAYQVNVAGTGLLLEALRRHAPQAHLIFASTAQVYAAPQGEEIQTGVIFEETRTIAPQNLYARTKWLGEELIRNAVRIDRLPATIVRIFNHTHHGQSPDFFLPYLYHRLAAAPPGQKMSIPIGNLNVRRDLGHVDDLVSALMTLMTSTLLTSNVPANPPAIYNICSGNARDLGKLARLLAQTMGIDAEFVVDPARVREGEPSSILGSHAALTAATGWRPTALDNEKFIERFLAP